MSDANIAKDYTDAGNYITDYYSRNESIIDDYGDAARAAVNNFFLISTIKEEKLDFSLFSVLIEVTALVLPHVRVVKLGADKAIKAAKDMIQYDYLDDSNKDKLKAIAGKLAEKAEDLAKDNIKKVPEAVAGGKAGGLDENAVRIYAVKANDEVGRLKGVMRGFVIFEREVMRNSLSLMYENKPERRGRLKNMLAQEILGSLPVYDPTEIQNFGKRYELSLYRKFYEKKAYQKWHIYFNYHNNLTSVSIEGLPAAVGKRVVALSGMPTLRDAVIPWNLRIVRHYESLVRIPGKV